MARNILVSLVSDQTIPNVLFIRNQPQVDVYVFVSTDKMEKKGVVNNIINATKNKILNPSTIIVEEDNLDDIESKLSKMEVKSNDHFIINVTGGTKVMSIGVFDFFSKKKNSEIYYIPLGKNIMLQIFPERSLMPTLLDFRINLEDYLIANGVTPESGPFENKNKLSKKEELTTLLYREFSAESNQILKQAAEHFRRHRNNDKIKILHLNNEESWYLQPFVNAGFLPDKNNELSKSELKYCSGDWFEEYIYSLIKSIKGKNDDEIGFGIYLNREKVKNEFDVIFTHNNALYVIECKTDITNEEGKFADLFNNTLYKAGSLRKDFGLFVKFYLFSVNDFSSLSNEKKDRARVLDINLVGTELLNDRDALIQFIEKM